MTDSFPASFVDLLKARYIALMPTHQTVGRPLRPSDPHQTIGVFSGDWNPVQESTENGGPSAGEPTLGRYNVMVQNVVIDADEERGRSLSSTNAKIIRAVLYRDATLKVSLAGLSESLLGREEHFTRFGVGRQRYISDTVRGGWIYLTTTEIWFETQTL